MDLLPARQIRSLYAERAYPPMSHPVADPASTSVAARLAGLATPHPARARILEIGCSSAHNLLPLALRWPESVIHGIDLSAPAVALARDRVSRAGIPNLRVEELDLLDFRKSGEPYDFIIAHGFFSWVPDEVKKALFDFCRARLSSSGIAAISFNVEAGWRARMPWITKAKNLRETQELDTMAALEKLRQSTADAASLAILDDMLAKGPDILPFDDFAPVNDPWPLGAFVATAARAGLHWLGEADPADNLPALPDEEMAALLNQSANLLAFQQSADEALGKTFRTVLLCRDDAPLEPKVSSAVALAFSVRPAATTTPDDALHHLVARHAPECLPVSELLAGMPEAEKPRLAGGICAAIQAGTLRARIEPVRFDPRPPLRPKLDALRLLCAREQLPVVDAFHVPCSFPTRHLDVLSAMDGTRTRDELAALARDTCPELAFGPWLAHLAGRGFFS